ncbi:galactose-binding domain-like protein [Geranomyces variabilis]|nr:galactose-binding domain-like protein [Geranomyces variabilis]
MRKVARRLSQIPSPDEHADPATSLLFTGPEMPTAHENRALVSAGARVAMTTSSDARHPVENIIDGNTKTFWMTTGLYPQEIVVSLPELVAVTKIIVTSTKVAHWTADVSAHEKPHHFERLATQDVEDSDQGLQITTLSLPKADNMARHVRLGATKGHGPFASVHKVAVYGNEPGMMVPTPPPPTAASDSGGPAVPVS